MLASISAGACNAICGGACSGSGSGSPWRGGKGSVPRRTDALSAAGTVLCGGGSVGVLRLAGRASAGALGAGCGAEIGAGRGGASERGGGIGAATTGWGTAAGTSTAIIIGRLSASGRARQPTPAIAAIAAR